MEHAMQHVIGAFCATQLTHFTNAFSLMTNRLIEPEQIGVIASRLSDQFKASHDALLVDQSNQKDGNDYSDYVSLLELGYHGFGAMAGIKGEHHLEQWKLTGDEFRSIALFRDFQISVTEMFEGTMHDCEGHDSTDVIDLIKHKISQAFGDDDGKSMVDYKPEDTDSALRKIIDESMKGVAEKVVDDAPKGSEEANEKDPVDSSTSGTCDICDEPSEALVSNGFVSFCPSCKTTPSKAEETPDEDESMSKLLNDSLEAFGNWLKNNNGKEE